ncbi:MAG: hypothetical protein Q8O66_03130 [bacterium]|nr:hypothetical protein [bacterium]
MIARDKSIHPSSVLFRDLQNIIDILLMPVCILPINRRSAKILEKAGIEFVGDIVQVQEEKFAIIPCSEREKIRFFLTGSGLAWGFKFSPFLRYIYQCAKAYSILKPTDEDPKIYLLTALLLGDEINFHVKNLNSFDLSSLGSEEELAKKIGEITRQVFSQIFKKT